MLRLLPPSGKIKPEGLSCHGKEKQKSIRKGRNGFKVPLGFKGSLGWGGQRRIQLCQDIQTSLLGAGRANTSAGEAGRAASAPGGWKPREASTAEVLGAGKGVGAGNAQPSSWTRNESRPCEHHVGQGVGIREKHGLEILHGTSSV